MPRPGLLTIGAVLDAALDARPDADAVVARSGRLTYRELDRAADRAGGALWAQGVRPGDRVAACLPNDLDVVVAFHGVARIGAIWVGIGESLTEVEQEQLLRHCGARVLLAGPRSKATPVGCTVLDEQAWSDLRAVPSELPQVTVRPEDPAGIAYTSGTTGLPQGIVHSHRNLLLPGEVLTASRGWGPDLRKGDCLPLTILNMLVLTTLATAQAQGCCIVMDRRDAEGIAEWVADERVTVWNGAPAQLWDLARRPDADLSTLREVWSGGGDCSEALREAFAAAHGRGVCATYGLTEAPTVVAIDPVDATHQASASGRVLPHLLVTSTDKAGRPMADGTVGEITIEGRVNGPWANRWTPLLGYWAEGGIVAAPDGWVIIVDRKKLVIVRGGANVYPAEVERVIGVFPGVEAAVVFGVDDDRLGQRVGALVQASSPIDLSALRVACEQVLARYKVPEQWGVVPQLPTNAMGKVIRTHLPDLLAAQGVRDGRHRSAQPDPKR